MIRTALIAVAAVATSGFPAGAGEGMWTFDGFPTARVNRELGTRVDQAWLDRVRAGSVKLGGLLGLAGQPRGADPDQQPLHRHLQAAALHP
jgi:hypothetical protein